MKHNLPDSIASPQDLTALLLEIRDYARWFAQAAVKKRAGNKRAAAPPELSPAASELIAQQTAKKPLSQQSLDALIKTLETYASTAPTITITLAAPPTGDIKSRLVVWCRANISPNVLVNFRFNSTLLGGMVVRCGSRIFDWSFRRQILANRQQFPEVLRRV